MRNSAVSSSRWAFRRCCWASGGTTSLTAVLRRRPIKVATSTSRSASRLIGPSPGKAHLQLPVLHRGAHGLPVGKDAGQCNLAAIVADCHEEIAVLTGQRDVLPVNERHLNRQYVFSAVLDDPLRGAFVEALCGVPVSIDHLRHPQQHPFPHYLFVEERDVEDWQRRKRLLHLAGIALMYGLPLAEELVLKSFRQEAVDD